MALEIVARQGGAKLRIRDLTRRLGVSTGSFYWHFRGRDDFVASLVDYWGKEFTARVIEDLAKVEGDARKRLLALMEHVVEHDFARYDVAIRAWAAQEPAVARRVRGVDQQRLRFIRALFEEMGFAGTELEVRSSTVAVFHSLELGFLAMGSKKERLRQLAMGSKKERLRQLRARHAFFANAKICPLLDATSSALGSRKTRERQRGPSGRLGLHHRPVSIDSSMKKTWRFTAGPVRLSAYCHS
jgi:AcrR family transcriptional regulator